MIWEPCLDDTCCPPLTNGGGMTVPELLPVKIWSEEKHSQEQRDIQYKGGVALICCSCACVIVEL